MKRFAGIFILLVTLCAAGPEANAQAACNQNKLNKKIMSFNKQCDKALDVVNVKIPTADDLLAQEISAADSKLAQAIDKARSSEESQVEKAEAKITFYTLKQAEKLAACALNFDFICNAAISFANKITQTVAKIEKIHLKADQTVAKATSGRDNKVAKLTTKHDKTVAQLNTKLNSFINKGNQYEHQAVLLPGCDIAPDVEPFLCEPLF